MKGTKCSIGGRCEASQKFTYTSALNHNAILVKGKPFILSVQYVYIYVAVRRDVNYSTIFYLTDWFS